ncbi:isochorismatase-family hydrolase [Thecamonas trahens ATCC 50062]|uniref:Isochorismatase-family hydrolase n=1 Tax=Thecamonas trahens ATCC 50062 TaxID=461836 RepID=A0A0L0D1X4_THETB|nr:isochorismatase-family hydrolase [Thecamonas trahens ATCC 50062]KNC46115.1 isochorismatase-family hydrolase [Thecamonas trahens ATCC 50062]|eukprot:XP_013763092.1 isochorismatase-family hydrolase [Thecamonas trahens ATCC 50062]
MASPFSTTASASSAALILCDFQAGIIGSVLGEGEHEAVANGAKLLAKARAVGMPVFYVVVRFREGHPEVAASNKMFSGLAAPKADGSPNTFLVESDPSAGIVDAVAPLPSEPVVVKRRVGAFSTTDLRTLLSAAGVDSLVLAGFSTSGVILSTVRAAADMDYRIVVAADACGDRSDTVHSVLCDSVFARQADVGVTDDVIAWMDSRAE